MIPEIGQIALLIALALSVILSVFPLIGAQRGITSWMQLAVPAARLQLLFVFVAFLLLTWAFVQDKDYANALRQVRALDRRAGDNDAQIAPRELETADPLLAAVMAAVYASAGKKKMSLAALRELLQDCDAAVYNVGFAHLEDARIITERRGMNPDDWNDVRDSLPLLAQAGRSGSAHAGRNRDARGAGRAGAGRCYVRILRPAPRIRSDRYLGDVCRQCRRGTGLRPVASAARQLPNAWSPNSGH